MKPQPECSHQEQLEQPVQEAIILEYLVESMKLQILVSASLFDVTAVCGGGIPGIIKYPTKQTRMRLMLIIFAGLL